MSRKRFKRIIWPLLIAYLDNVRYVVAWCETRQGFRHFKTDRVQDLNNLEQKYPARRADLIRAWEEETAQRMANRR